MSPDVEYAIELSKKPVGYAEAVARYLKSEAYTSLGHISFEQGHPEVKDLSTPAEQIDRLHAIREDSVCAHSTSVKMDEEYLVIKVKSIRSASIDLEKLWPSARLLVKGGSSVVCRVIGFDLIPKTEHTDFN